MRIFHIAKIRQTARRAKLWAAFLEKTVCRPMYGERGWSVCGVRKGKWAGVPLVFLPAEILYPPAFSIYPPTFFCFRAAGPCGGGISWRSGRSVRAADGAVVYVQVDAGQVGRNVGVVAYHDDGRFGADVFQKVVEHLLVAGIEVGVGLVNDQQVGV